MLDSLPFHHGSRPLWLYIFRGLCAFFIVIIDLGHPFISKYYNTASTVRTSPRHYLLLSFLLLLYFWEDAPLLVESQRQDRHTAVIFSASSLSLSIAFKISRLVSQEIEQVWYAHIISWTLLSVFEIFNVIYLCQRPTAPLPLILTLPIMKGLICIALILSDLANATETNSKECAGDGDGKKKMADDDRFGIRLEAGEEARELGGWWPFVKRARIFLKYMWPWGRPLLQLRAILVIFIVAGESFLDVLKHLQYAAFLDAVVIDEGVARSFWIWFLIDTLGSNRSLVTLRKWLWIDVGYYRHAMLKSEVHTHILSLDADFHASVEATDLIKAVDYAGDVDKVLDTVYFGLMPNLIYFILAFTGLLRFGTFMILILAYTIIVYLLLQKKSVTVLAQATDEYNTANDFQELGRHDGVEGWLTVFNNDQVKHECCRYKSLVKSWLLKARRYYLRSYLFGFLRSWTLELGSLAATGLILREIRAERLIFSDLVVFTGLWKYLLKSTNYFGNLPNEMIKEILGVTRLRRILEVKPSIRDGDKDLEYVNGKVEFNDVSFSYPGTNQMILNHINIKIDAGTKVAIVGPSGIGKSTLIQLIKRMYIATEGSVLIDGQDIASLKNSRQQLHLFDNTVMYNIKYSKETATDEEVYAASHEAGLHDTIERRHHKYQSRVKANGKNFSGGEKQRLALARVFLQNPDMLLVDEATAALDAETEAHVKNRIEEKFANRTVIIIAHRLSSIKKVDRILVLGESGGIIEDGRHEDLVKSNGVYANSWRLQTGGETKLSPYLRPDFTRY